MNPHDIRNSVLEKIKKENIKPRPKWIFWLRNSVFWIFFALAVYIGARAFGVLLWSIYDTDFSFLAMSHGFSWFAIVRFIPTFWIIFLLLFLLLAVCGLHHTRRGYKMSVWKLAIGNIVLSLVGGSIFYALDDPQHFEKYVHTKVPYFGKHEDNRVLYWSAPEEGRLGGVIVKVVDGKMFLLDDFKKKQWTVTYSIEATKEKKYRPEEGKKVRVVGTQTGDLVFYAEVVAPWKGPRLPVE